MWVHHHAVLGYCLQICGSHLVSLSLDESLRAELETEWLEPGFALPHSLLHDVVLLEVPSSCSEVRFTLEKGIEAQMFSRRF